MSPVTTVSRRVRAFDRSWRAELTLKRLIDGVFAGIWLGLLDREAVHEFDRLYYGRTEKYHDSGHNRQGLMDWEEEMLTRFFPEQGSLLVGAVGGGREAIALRHRGYDVDAFECHPVLVRLANRLLAEEGFPETVVEAPRDACPSFDRLYDGLIVGWGGYMHVQGRRRRVPLLRAMRQHAKPGAPILLSFHPRWGKDRYWAVVARTANVLRTIRRREQVERGDDLLPYFAHFFSREELAGELNEAGFRLEYFAERPYGHAVGRAVGE